MVIGLILNVTSHEIKLTREDESTGLYRLVQYSRCVHGDAPKIVLHSVGLHSCAAQHSCVLAGIFAYGRRRRKFRIDRGPLRGKA